MASYPVAVLLEGKGGERVIIFHRQLWGKFRRTVVPSPKRDRFPPQTLPNLRLLLTSKSRYCVRPTAMEMEAGKRELERKEGGSQLPPSDLPPPFEPLWLVMPHCVIKSPRPTLPSYAPVLYKTEGLGRQKRNREKSSL